MGGAGIKARGDTEKHTGTANKTQVKHMTAITGGTKEKKNFQNKTN